MKNSGKVNGSAVILATMVFSFCLVIFHAMQTKARTPANTGNSAGSYELSPAAVSELRSQLEQATSEIAELKARLMATESRMEILQGRCGDLNRQISLLNGEIQKAKDSMADDHKIGLKIHKVKRFAGGKPEPMDMVVSINKFSITWKQIDAILDKLDEITHTLSRP